MRLPTIVTTSRVGATSRGQCAPGSISKAMPRSCASAALPSSSAVSAGSSTESTTRSVSSWETCSSSVAKSSARSLCPSSMRLTIVWSRFADSWACERSASVRPRAESSSPGQGFEVGAVAQRRDVAEQASLPAGRSAVQHEHPRRRHVQLVLVRCVVGERGRQGGGEAQLGDRASDGVGGQGEQSGRLVVREPEVTVEVGDDEALGDGVQDGVVVLVHLAQLLLAEAVGLAPDPA